jgi:hypothetical protein
MIVGSSSPMPTRLSRGEMHHSTRQLLSRFLAPERISSAVAKLRQRSQSPANERTTGGTRPEGRGVMGQPGQVDRSSSRHRTQTTGFRLGHRLSGQRHEGSLTPDAPKPCNRGTSADAQSWARLPQTSSPSSLPVSASSCPTGRRYHSAPVAAPVADWRRSVNPMAGRNTVSTKPATSIQR